MYVCLITMASSTKMDEETICKLKEELQSYDYVRFTWPDIHGIQRGITVAKRNVPSFLSSGVYTYCGG